MARKVAKYQQEESALQLYMLEREKRAASHAITRKVNKASNRKLLDMYLNGELTYTEITNHLYTGERRKSAWNDLFHILGTKKPESHQRMKLLLDILEGCDEFMENPANVRLISIINEWDSELQRDPAEWSPSTRNIYNQAESLLEHCFIKYPVPKFLYNSMYTGHVVGTFLLFHLTQGNSYKTFCDKPKLVLPSKIYQYLFDVPSDLSYYQGFRWAQIHAMGGDHYVFNAFMQSKLREEASEKQDEFWVTVIKFFIEHSMIDREKISEVVDYIYEMKFQPQLEQRGQLRVYGKPLHPGFSMKGRTPESLIGASDEWHNQVARFSRAGGPSEWKPQLIADYEHRDGDGKLTHVIMQLCNAKALQDEGRRMGHCVGTYARSAAEGRCAIFSLRNRAGESLVTIEVRGKELVQIKAKYNKPPTESHMYHVRKWALQENLGFSRWLI